MAVPDAMTVQEAMEVFDLWSKDNAIPSGTSSSISRWVKAIYDIDVRVAPTDELFMSKYSESCGNARDFVWKGLLASLST